MSSLTAWIEEEPGSGWFTAYWINPDDPERRISRQTCQDYAHARQRVEREARDLGVEVEWAKEEGF